MAFGFYFDMTRCIGCRACQVACKDKNRLEVGTLYRNVKSYTVGTFPNVKSYSYSGSCNHCESPICLANCPTGAIGKAEDGTVVQDQNKCIGCRMCEKTCKFDAIHVVDGVAKIDYDKCKNCKMCTKACPKGCIEPVPTAEEVKKFKEMQAKQAAAAKAKAEAAKAAETAAPASEDK